MEELFVSYELAKLSKEKGFDESCFAFYQIEQYEDTPVMVDDDIEYRNSGFRTCKNNEIPEHYVSAPLYQQLVDWFREKHNIHISIITSTRSGYLCTLEYVNLDKAINITNSGMDYYKLINKAIEETFKLI